MIFRTFPVHCGSVTVGWDADNDTFYARGTNTAGRRVWEYANGMPTLAQLRAVLCGHRVTLHGVDATSLLHDMDISRQRASRTASRCTRGGR
ncbi:hypothetical protein ABT158_48680 [Nonomuraea sp. NPDC001636]|uniref:hypothetical protein n=1 Tax=Nonomuraea sp. NPDC001636 TaxID=3154391 RepID=UPI003317D437